MKCKKHKSTSVCISNKCLIFFFLFSIRVQKKAASQLCRTAKDLYDCTKSTEVISPGNTLPKLLTDNFDDEQIWQEVELQNNHCITGFLEAVSQLAASKSVSFRTTSGSLNKENTGKQDFLSQKHNAILKKKVKDRVKFLEEEDQELTGSASDDQADLRLDKYDLPSDEESEEEKEMKRLLEKTYQASEEETEQEEDDDDDVDFNFDIESQPKKSKKTASKKLEDTPGDSESFQEKPKKRKSVVDDKFFKLAELEEFLEQEDRREERRIRREEGGKDGGILSSDEEDSVDMFGDLPSDGEVLCRVHE